MLMRARPAGQFSELVARRAVLLDPMADAQTRDVGTSLGTLRHTLMSREGTRGQFAEAAHAIDAALQAHSDMPGQASLIAYADLRLQWQTANMRWPSARPEPGPPGSAGAA